MEQSSNVDIGLRPSHPGSTPPRTIGSAGCAPGGGLYTRSRSHERLALCSEEKQPLSPEAGCIEPRPSDSMETHQPVTLAWSNIDVFVRDKKKKKTTPAEVDVELGKDGTVKASSEKYGRKQIISNGE
ncbi:hypothetical protein BaRGS_00001355 [Batillaria attramentaria]|uniref:Uncharacterized protein n=1 Tax=Batillaria attramentaria TaxID=370345 RepID=A0ABD0M7F7_9CAEN